MAELKQLIEQILSGQLIAKRDEWIDRNAIAPLVDELKCNSLGLARQAADAIVAMSPEAESIRFLMLPGSDVLKQERIQRRLLVLAIRLAQRQPESFLPLLQDESAEVRLSVAEALWEAGVARSEALVSIVESLDDEQCAGAAMTLLSRIGSAAKLAIPRLLGRAQTEGAQDRYSAIRTLGSIGAAGIPALTQLLRDQDANIRSSAARELGTIGVPDATAEAELGNLLLDESPKVVAASATTLGLIGASSETITERLSALLAHADASVRGAAATFVALSNVSVEIISQYLDSHAVETRLAAVRALLYRGLPANELFPDVVAALESDNRIIRYDAIDLLGWMGTATTAAVDALAELVRCDTGSRRAIEAIDALKMLGAIQQLSDLLSLEGDVARKVAATLMNFGPQATLATKQLIANFARDMKSIETGYALAAIGPAAIPELVAGLHSSCARTVRRCMDVLRRMPPIPLQEYATEIETGLRVSRDVLVGAPNEFSPQTLIDLICRVGLPESETAYWLLEQIVARNSDALATAVLDFARSGLSAYLLLPYLPGLLESDDAENQIDALQAVVALGKSAAEMEPYVRALFGSNQGPAIATRVAFALWKISGDADPVSLSASISFLKMCTWQESQELAILLEFPAEVRIPLVLDALDQGKFLNQGLELLVELPGFQDERLWAITQWLYSSDDYCQTALEALGRLGPVAKPALLSVRRHLHTSMPLTRVWAAYALWKIEGTSAEAVATLACILRDDSDNGSSSPRVLAAQLLRKIGAPDESAASALRFATLSRELRIREAATQALASLDCKE